MAKTREKGLGTVVGTDKRLRPSTLGFAFCVLMFLCVEGVTGKRWYQSLDQEDGDLSVVVVFNNEPPDTTTFFSYLDFATGLSQYFPEANFSLLTYNNKEDNLQVNFEPTIGANLSSGAWMLRGLADTTGEKINNLLHGADIVVSLDVNGTHEKSVCKYESVKDVYYAKVFIDKKCYQIFTRNPHRQVKNDTICEATITQDDFLSEQLVFTVDYTSLTQLKRTFFCNVSEFYENFEFIYDDLDRNEYTRLSTRNCRHSLCFEGRSFVESSIVAYDIFNYFEENNFSNKWSIIIAQNNGRYTWYEADSYCSAHGLSLLTVQNEPQSRTLKNLLLFLLHTKRYNNKELIFSFPMGLTRSNTKRGRRFVYNEKRDLMLAFWDDDEPNHPRWKHCAGNSMKIVKRSRRAIYRVEDYGWFTVACGQRRFRHVVCQSNTPPKKADLIFAPELKTEKFSAMEIFPSTYIRKEKKTLVTSITFKLATWFADNGVNHFHFGFGGEISTYEMKTTLQSELQHFFHRCSSENENYSTMVIPAVYLCDGKTECPSGSDESVCGLYGIASCTSEEWMCNSGQCVPKNTRCDLIQDCQDGSDEEDCGFKCQHRVCGDGYCLPKPWFSDGQRDCDDGSDERIKLKPGDVCVLLCNRTQCVTPSMLNNSVVDCKGPEGPLDETIGALESITCTKPNGDGIANSWAPKCILSRDSFGEIIGCRYFQHLQNCKNFICPPGYVKCPNSFCIPLSYVGDGKDDCYEGEDEMSPILPDREVTVFQCQLSGKQAVPFSSLCDGRRDCYHGEDELDCGVSCLPGLVCIAGAVSAVTYNRALPILDLSFIDARIRHLDLSGVDVQHFFTNFPRGNLTHLLTLKLSRCNISSIMLTEENVNLYGNQLACANSTQILDFKTVKILDLSYNQLESLPRCSYIRLMLGLGSLNVSHNYLLSKLSELSFRGYFELTTLDISFTAIKTIDKDTFQDLVSLKTLNLKQSRLTRIDFTLPANLEYFNVDNMTILHVGKDALRNVISIKEIHSPTYKLCCPQVNKQTNRHVCHFPLDQFLSCNNLIEEVFLRLSLWFVSASIIAGNSATLFYRLVWDTQVLSKPYGLFVSNLGVSDLIMGVYLLLVGVADVRYHEEYVFYDYFWRNSATCWAAGTMATLSSLTSTLFLLLITIERYLAVRYPFGEIRLPKKAALCTVVSVWLFGVCAAVIPFLPFAQNWIIYSNNGVCLGLPLKSKRLSGWLYSATLFIGFNFVLFASIGVGQVIIFKTIRAQGKRIRESTNQNSQLRVNQRIQEFAIAKQLSVIVLTDFVCLFPVITMGILTLVGYDVGDAAYRWTAVLVIPINSALNPFLYTLPAIKAKWLEYQIYLKENKRNSADRARKLQSLEGKCQSAKATRRQRIKMVVICFKRLLRLRGILTRVESGRTLKENLRELSGHVNNLMMNLEKLLEK